MTQSLPAQSKSVPSDVDRHQRLMELIEAEDGANGEVGCGRDWGNRLSSYLSTRGIALEDEKLKSLLRKHLGQVLREPDFDSIATQIQRQIEYLVVQGTNNSLSSDSPLAKVAEYIPTEELKNLFQSQIADFCDQNSLEKLIQVSHQIIHKALLQPRHTWPQPIWVLRSERQIYIAQAAGIEEAIAKVKTQYRQETGKLVVIKVGGILAPDQVICISEFMPINY